MPTLRQSILDTAFIAAENAIKPTLNTSKDAENIKIFAVFIIPDLPSDLIIKNATVNLPNEDQSTSLKFFHCFGASSAQPTRATIPLIINKINIYSSFVFYLI